MGLPTCYLSNKDSENLSEKSGDQKKEGVAKI